MRGPPICTCFSEIHVSKMEKDFVVSKYMLVHKILTNKENKHECLFDKPNSLILNRKKILSIIASRIPKQLNV